MLMKVLSANAATSTSAEKISGQTNRQTNKQTNKLDQSQDIVTGNAHVSCKKSYNIYLISAYYLETVIFTTVQGQMSLS